MKRIHRSIAIVAVAVASGLAGNALADTVSVLDVAAFSPAAAETHVHMAGEGGHARAASAPPETLLAAAGSPRAERTPIDVSLAIWYCVRVIQAQRDHQPLRLLESRLAVVDRLTPQVSAVPLPGAAWMMLMGLLGVVGVRLNAPRRAAGAGTRVGLPAWAQAGPG
jgi:hypothetical protein